MNTPQAWLLAGQWKYNYLGALKEAIAVAQARGKILEEVWPTEKQQLQFFAGIP